MKRLLALPFATLIIGVAALTITPTAVRAAEECTIKCDKCICNIKTGICDCTGCTLTGCKVQ